MTRLSPLPRRTAAPRTEVEVDSLELSERRLETSGWGRAGVLVALMGASLGALAGPSTPGLIQATPADAARLSARYQKVDPKILQLLEKDGVTISVVRPGQSFAATGVLTARSLADYQAEMGKMQATAKRIEAATAPYARGIARLQQSGGDSSQLQRERRMVLLDNLPQDSLAVPFSIPSLADLVRDSDGLHKLAQQQKMPKGTTLMAQLVGAKTPAQVQEYTQLVEAINGPRLEQARQAGLAAATPAQQAAWIKDPGQIPLDLKGYDILVPDLAYVADGHGGSLRVNLLDASVHGAWADAKGKTVSNSSINGQYFFPSRKILVQSSRLGTPTSVHELGHAIEDAVSRHDPKFFNSWHSQLFIAYQRAVQSGTVSDYATSNAAEYIAEGVSHYYENPEVLRQKDPKLYELTRQLLERAARCGGS